MQITIQNKMEQTKARQASFKANSRALMINKLVAEAGGGQVQRLLDRMPTIQANFIKTQLLPALATVSDGSQNLAKALVDVEVKNISQGKPSFMTALANVLEQKTLRAFRGNHQALASAIQSQADVFNTAAQRSGLDRFDQNQFCRVLFHLAGNPKAMQDTTIANVLYNPQFQTMPFHETMGAIISHIDNHGTVQETPKRPSAPKVHKKKPTKATKTANKFVDKAAEAAKKRVIDFYRLHIIQKSSDGLGTIEGLEAFPAKPFPVFEKVMILMNGTRDAKGEKLSNFLAGGYQSTHILLERLQKLTDTDSFFKKLSVFTNDVIDLENSRGEDIINPQTYFNVLLSMAENPDRLNGYKEFVRGGIYHGYRHEFMNDIYNCHRADHSSFEHRNIREQQGASREQTAYNYGEKFDPDGDFQGKYQRTQHEENYQRWEQEDQRAETSEKAEEEARAKAWAEFEEIFGGRTAEDFWEDFQDTFKSSKSRQRTSNSNNANSSGGSSRSSTKNTAPTSNIGKFNELIKKHLGESEQLHTNASKDDIKSIYRKLQRKVHPDLGGSVEEAQKVNAIYDELKV